MEYRRLGKTGLRASRIGFGCNRIAQSAAPNHRREVEAILETAFERGINFFDTADVYSNGESERLLGKLFRGRRERVILCSKAGYRPWALVPWSRWVSPLLTGLRRLRPALNRNPRSGGKPRPPRNYAPRILRLGVEGSLRRLGTDYLDVFCLHSPPPEVVADERVFEGLEDLKQAGLIRHYGVSFAAAATSDEVLCALRHSGISILQVLVNPLKAIDLERIVAPAAAAGIAIVGRQPFHRGAVFESRYRSALFSSRPDRTVAQTVLRSVLQRPGIDVVLTGMTTREHLDENLAALAAPPLSAQEINRLYSLTQVG
jgi:aryl-alcohol dehydrogenase-like predicted oxidoreductase